MNRGEENLSGKPTLPSDKHDILYSRARYVLNQRYIKRPWFNLNPFLEKTDERIDLEDFLPDESKYIQKLESLVICESYTSNIPIETRELTIGNFFSYIYSDIWNKCTSVRILDGQLFDQLLLSLHKMEKEGTIVRHKTYAFAKNQRPLTRCYKLADKEAFGHIDETLLIEFTYFGHLDKAEPNLVTSNPLDYLYKHRRQANAYGPLAKPPVFERHLKSRTRAASINMDDESLKQKLSDGKDDKDSFGLSTSTKRKGSLSTKPINVFRTVDAMRPTGRRLSLQLPAAGPISFVKTFTPTPEKRQESIPEKLEPVPKLPQLPQRRRASITGSVDFSDFRISKNLKKQFDSLAELEDELIAKEKTAGKRVSVVTEDNDIYYGEELYLTDAKFQNKTKPETALSILKRKKKELQQRRLREKQAASERARKLKEIQMRKMRTNLQPIAELEPDRQTHSTLNMPEKMPTFEEFIQFLQDDEYFDPRYRNKGKQKSMKIAKRYNLETDFFPRLATSSADFDSANQRLAISGSKYQQGTSSKRCLDGIGSRGMVRLPTLREQGANIRDGSRFADEVLGVTDSEPCKEHCLIMLGLTPDDREAEGEIREKPNRSKQYKSSEDVPQVSKVKRTKRKTPDIIVNSPSGNKEILFQGRSSPIFPKISKDNDIVEPPDTDSSEDTSDNDDKSQFDSGKLNLKYSLERLRKKKRRAKKKPAFFDVLRKYYRAQSVLRAFRKNSVGNEQQTARDRTRRLKLGTLFKKAVADKPAPSPSREIGKLKSFRFLEKEPKTRRVSFDKIHKADFSSPSVDDFHAQLEKSLKDFVVRREIVVSDLNARCATSITFTKRNTFKPRKQPGVGNKTGSRKYRK